MNFNIGDLSAWAEIPIGEPVEFAVPEGGVRTVAFDVLADEHVSVRVLLGDLRFLVGAGSGMFSCRFTIRETAYLLVEGVASALVFIRADRPLPVVHALGDSHTRIEPRQSGMSADMLKIAHMMRLNSERREADLRAEIAALAARLEARTG